MTANRLQMSAQNEEVVHPIILFDGVCHLCNGMVQFIIQHDPDVVFRFAPLQSAYGQRQMNSFGLGGQDLDSLVLLDNGQVFLKSDAVIGIAAYLNRPWFLIHFGRILPRSIRDKAYDILATHRYRWFGRKPTCMMPSLDIRARFLE